MLVKVMHIGRMRVLVPESLVTVPVGVWLARWIIGAVHMLMVFVVNVPMGMLHGLMHMLVIVRFGEMEPNANAHEPPGEAMDKDRGSRNIKTAAIAPTNGTVEK
jgi:hypothetical protein